MGNFIATHGSTIAYILLVLGFIEEYAPYIPGKYSGIILAVVGGLIKIIQSFTGTTSADATPRL